MAITTTTQLTPNISGFYSRTLLDRLNALTVYLGYGVEKPVPKNNGTQVTFRRYANLSNATTALTEGVTPAGAQLSKTDYAATLAQYGNFVTITDWVNLAGLDPVLTEAAQILGDNAAQTLDVIARDVLCAGTSVEYAGAATSTATVNAAISAADLWKAENFLARNNVMEINERIMPANADNTYAIDPGYIAIGHTDLRKDFEDIGTGFIKAREYANQKKLLPGEIGSHGRIRVILTGNGKITSGGGASGTTFRNDGANNDVYFIVVFGKGAYGNSRIGPRAIENIVKGFGSAGSADPLNQRATSGWKANYVCKILSDLRLVRIECACEDLSLDTAGTSE